MEGRLERTDFLSHTGYLAYDPGPRGAHRSRQAFTYDEHSAWMQKAIEEAHRACEHGDVPVGAVVVYDGVIIGRGHNRREDRQDPTAHAEILALREAATNRENWNLTGAALYVTLEPCAMCAGAIVLARIEHLVYGAVDSKAGAAGSVINIVEEPKLNHHPHVTGGVCADECAGLLREFFGKIRRAKVALATRRGG